MVAATAVPGLEAHETVLARCRVVLTAASMLPAAGPRPRPAAPGRRGPGQWSRSAPAAGTGRRGLRARPVAEARRLGVAVPGRLFVVGLTEERLVIWEPTTWLARPRRVAVSLPLHAVAAVESVGWLGRRRLRVRLPDGALLVMGPLWSRGLPGLAGAFEDLRALR